MAEKVEILGVARQKDQMYYVADGAVWRIARKGLGQQEGEPAKVADGTFEMDSAYIYFLDEDGDVSRAKLAKSSRAKGSRQMPDAGPSNRKPNRTNDAVTHREANDHGGEDKHNGEEEIDETGEEHPPIPVPSRWRRFVLQRESSLHHEASETSVQAIQLFERIDSGGDPEDPDFRLWALGVVDEQPWSFLDVLAEGHCIRILFPSDSYYGMPSHLDLERPLKPRIAGSWRLLRPDAKATGVFVLKEVGELTDVELQANEQTLMVR